MSRKIGLRLDSLTLAPREAMAQAAALKMQGIEINCARGELTPDQLDRQARKHLRHFVDDLQLEVVALGGDTGFRFGGDSTVERFLDDTKAVLDLAVDLRVGMVTTAIGSVPESPGNPNFGLVTEVLSDIGNYAANRERCLAISAGLDKPETLAALLDRLGNDGLCVNYDPANMVFGAYDPVQSVAALGRTIVAVRARDGRRYLDGSLEELPLGKGDVRYDEFVEALDAIDFHGYFVIARMPRSDLTDEIEAARRFLERY